MQIVDKTMIIKNKTPSSSQITLSRLLRPRIKTIKTSDHINKQQFSLGYDPITTQSSSLSS